MPLYVPLLKGKEGEFAAIEALSPEVKSQIIPFIEVPPIPYDYINERDARTLGDHLEPLPGRLSRVFGERSFYLSVPPQLDEETVEGQCPLGLLLDKCAGQRLRPIPVLTTLSSERALDAARRCFEGSEKELCIRLDADDLDEEDNPEEQIARVLRGAGFHDARNVDVLVDLGDLGGDLKRSRLIARSVINQVPRLTEWRRLILAGASFPEDLSDVSAASTTSLTRQEWLLWLSLRSKPGNAPRADWIFADYAVSSPVLRDLDPRLMRMSANIRYTTSDGWLIVKGRNVRQYGFSQFNDLCRVLVERPEYCGRDYSWGDRFIADCALGSAGPGNATTWRKVGVNHHLTLVANAVASLPPVSSGNV